MLVSEKINECYQLISRKYFASAFSSLIENQSYNGSIGSFLQQINTHDKFLSIREALEWELRDKIFPIIYDIYRGISASLLEQHTKESKELFISDTYLLVTLLDLDIKESIIELVASIQIEVKRFDDEISYDKLNKVIYAEYHFSDRNLINIFSINYLQTILHRIDGLLFSIDRRFGHYINESTKEKIQLLKTEDRVYSSFSGVGQENPNTDSSFDIRRLEWKGTKAELTELTIALINADMLKFERGKNTAGEIGSAFINTFLHNDKIDIQKYNLNIRDVKKRNFDREKVLIPKLDAAFDKYMKEGRKKSSSRGNNEAS